MKKQHYKQISERPYKMYKYYLEALVVDCKGRFGHPILIFNYDIQNYFADS